MSPVQRRCVTAGVMIATAIQVADALIANVALPQLLKDLGAGIELGAWIITSYLCATAVMAPLTGWLGDAMAPPASSPLRSRYSSPVPCCARWRLPGQS